MKRNLIKKFIIISLISIIFTMIISINTVQATNSNSEDIIKNEILESDEKIMMYDARTNTTTEVNMDTVKKAINRQDTSSNSVEPYNPIKSQRKVDSYGTYALSGSMTKITNTSSFPNKATCKLVFDYGSKLGTAAMVGPNAALTAAHCVFNPNNNDTYKNWTIYAGYSGGNYYGPATGWSQVYYSSKWMENHNDQYDWAICVLGDRLGDKIGCWYGSTSYGSNTADFKKLNVRVLGYPAESNSMTTGEYQYQTGGDVTTVGERYFRYQGWTVDGFSGGPIRRTNDNYIVGVHYGLVFNTPTGVRLTQEMIDIIRKVNNS